MKLIYLVLILLLTSCNSKTEIIEKFAFGEVISLQITAMTAGREITHLGFGFVPDALKDDRQSNCKIINFVAKNA